MAGPMPRPGPPQLRESRSSRPRTRPSWHADRPLPAAALDAALLDYNIFNCCLLRDLLAAAARGYGSVLALLVCVSLGVTLWALPKSCACTWLWSCKVDCSPPVTFRRRCLAMGKLQERPERAATRARLLTDQGDIRSNQPVPKKTTPLLTMRRDCSVPANIK